jgi:hypothetical protein
MWQFYDCFIGWERPINIGGCQNTRHIFGTAVKWLLMCTFFICLFDRDGGKCLTQETCNKMAQCRLIKIDFSVGKKEEKIERNRHERREKINIPGHGGGLFCFQVAWPDLSRIVLLCWKFQAAIKSEKV